MLNYCNHKLRTRQVILPEDQKIELIRPKKYFYESSTRIFGSVGNHLLK